MESNTQWPAVAKPCNATCNGGDCQCNTAPSAYSNNRDEVSTPITTAACGCSCDNNCQCVDCSCEKLAIIESQPPTIKRDPGLPPVTLSQVECRCSAEDPCVCSPENCSCEACVKPPNTTTKNVPPPLGALATFNTADCHCATSDQCNCGPVCSCTNCDCCNDEPNTTCYCPPNQCTCGNGTPAPKISVGACTCADGICTCTDKCRCEANCSCCDMLEKRATFDLTSPMNKIDQDNMSAIIGRVNCNCSPTQPCHCGFFMTETTNIQWDAGDFSGNDVVSDCGRFCD